MSITERFQNTPHTVQYRPRDGHDWDTVRVRCVGDEVISYDSLRALSQVFGSTDIDVVYTEESGGYSEYTPTIGSECVVVVWLRKLPRHESPIEHLLRTARP